MTVKEIIDVANGTLLSGEVLDKKYYNFVNDSRKIKAGDVFFALKTETSDGNKFVDNAIEAGAGLCIIDNDEFLTKNNGVVILVEDVLKSIQKLANYNRNKYKVPVICVTGSLGKTISRELIKVVLDFSYNVLSPEGNLNNHIGLPMTLLKLNENYDLILLEAGMNHLNEIELLSNICEPNIAVITNIGKAHIGNLGSIENIKKAKLEILSGLKEEGVLFLNVDDDLLKDVSFENIIYFGNSDPELTPFDILLMKNGISFNIYYKKVKYFVEINAPGEHMVNNSLLAIKVGLYFGINIENILSQLKNYKPFSKRLDTFKIKSATIIDDSYNASSSSVKNAIDVLALYDNKKIAILGDMLELGEYSEQEHILIRDYLKSANIDEVLSVGDFSKLYDANIHFTNNDELINYMVKKDYLNQNVTILFKGSNGMKLFNVIEALKNS